jgi:hypothetical protein
VFPELTIDTHHIYRLGDRILPSTTQILGEYIKIELYGEVWWVHTPTGTAIAEHIMERARQIGNAIHKIAFYIFTRQGIDAKALNPILVEPARQLLLWAEKYKPEVILCEKPLASMKYGYAGMLDLFAKLKGHKRPGLIDIKSGLSLMVAYQVASYENLVHENQYKGMIDSFVLRIPKDGSPYEFQELKEKTAFTFFLNKLYEYNYLRSSK